MVVQRGGRAYKSPRVKIMRRPHFWALGICMGWMSFQGRKKMITSPMMFAAAFAYQNAVRLIHVPGTPLSQTRRMGIHSKIVAIMLLKAYRTT